MMAGLLARRSFAWLAHPAALPSKVRRWMRRWRATQTYREALRDGELLVEAGSRPASGLISVAMPTSAPLSNPSGLRAGPIGNSS
jgi:hypothetical protein